MRVLCVSSHLPVQGVHAGGARVFQILRGLARHHEIDIVSFISREIERESIPELKGICPRVDVVLRGQTHGLPNPFGLKPPSFLREWGNPQLKAAVATALGGGRYDVLLVEYLEATCALPRVLPIPAIFTHHEVQYAASHRAAGQYGIFDRRRWKTLLNALRMVRYERETCARFERVFTVSPQDASALRRYGPRLPIDVSSMGVDTEYFRAAEGEPEPATLVYIGYYEHSPNTDAAVWFVREILPLIRREVPECQLYLVGSYPTPPVLELGKVPGVTVTGRVPDLRPWLARATSFVAPIRLGTGMRGKVVEALASGRAVVSTRVGAAGLEAEDGRHLLLADEPAEFAAKTVQVLRNPDFRRRLGAAASALVRERYDWSIQVDKYHRAILELAADGDRIRRERQIAAALHPDAWPERGGWRDAKALWPAGVAWLVGKALGYRFWPGPGRSHSRPDPTAV